MFDRIISVDWSGAATENDGVALRVAVFDALGNASTIVDCRKGKRTQKNWSRQAFREWIVEQLRDERPALIAMDFGFGLPWGADRAIFGVRGWRAMLQAIAQRYGEAGTARATAEAINAEARFAGCGPYRFNEDRNGFRFYLDRQVAYFRQTELIAPQAISQWYLGSGGTVGFHTISGLSALDFLIQKREARELDFVVWPQEQLVPDGKKHVVVESYPAICPVPADFGPCLSGDNDQRDAWKVLQMLMAKRADRTLDQLFEIPELPFGRVNGVTFDEQVQFEGWILGLR
jgi:hypothetical protein